MKDCDFLRELKAKFNQIPPTHFTIFDDIFLNRKLVYCHWQTGKGIVSIDYQIINNEVEQIQAS
tara:strand:- start:100 stop:291 length:192 start_codon:yes stop_codon:yes gene_type:complete